MNETRSCTKGQFYRKSYTRTLKNGKTVHVKGRCIRSQSRYGSPLRESHVQMRGFRKTKRSLRSCPKGYIVRDAYVRITKRGKRVHVPEQCILDKGLPGKGFRGTKSGIGPLRKGELAKFGYHNVVELTAEERRNALRKAVKAYGSLGVWRKLNAVAVYTKYTSPVSSQIFKRDMDWVRSEFGIKAF